jgi:hypothetical protein
MQRMDPKDKDISAAGIFLSPAVDDRGTKIAAGRVELHPGEALRQREYRPICAVFARPLTGAAVPLSKYTSTFKTASEEKSEDI